MNIQRRFGAVDFHKQKVKQCHVLREVANTEVFSATQLLSANYESLIWAFGAVDSAEQKVTQCHVLREVANTEVFSATQLLSANYESLIWAFGAVGSASERHSEGQKFESSNAHFFIKF